MCMGWVKPRVGLGWIELSRDLFIFWGLGWVQEIGPRDNSGMSSPDSSVVTTKVSENVTPSTLTTSPPAGPIAAARRVQCHTGLTHHF